jgi:3-oxoadipate enol-lactonase
VLEHGLEANVPGVLHHEITGEGSPVVLLHEGIVDSRSWNKVVPLLAPHHTVVTYDQRGYGRSPRPDGPYSLVEDLASVLDTAGLDRAALVGTSRGGRIAIDFTLTYPDRVTALVPVASAMSGHRIAFDPAPDLERRWDEAEAAGDLAALADIDLEVWAPLGVDPELRAMAVENVEWSNAHDPGTWADPPAVGRLSEIHVPTLVITGGRDLRAITEIGDVLAAGISGARREVIEEADHVVGWRTPDELARLVREFLS